MIGHVLGRQQVADEQQTADDLPGRESRRGVDNPAVGGADRVQAEEIGVLRHHHPPGARRIGELLIVGHTTQASFLDGLHIAAATAQSLGHGAGYVLV